ncbi:hypothetical protein [Ammoniphilus resinae]|uniref:Holin n=1 Tax=Ammoniphilus resinae TaxID=861532 RepID=A0ABS4GV54_9BACL|nr:hypothetical protein [Ammoniphilus resinae]MBP1933760.1 hypothetical protein [Ammoniphilus resinae]
MFDNIVLDYATLSALVAALVSVLGNAFHIETRYRALIAIVIGVILVSMPNWLMEKSVAALLIGLTASGVYSQVKKRDYRANSETQTVDQNNVSSAESKGPLTRIKGPEDV